jgi:hypothetical protein
VLNSLQRERSQPTPGDERREQGCCLEDIDDLHIRAGQLPARGDPPTTAPRWIGRDLQLRKIRSTGVLVQLDKLLPAARVVESGGAHSRSHLRPPRASRRGGGPRPRSRTGRRPPCGRHQPPVQLADNGRSPPLRQAPRDSAAGQRGTGGGPLYRRLSSSSRLLQPAAGDPNSGCSKRGLAVVLGRRETGPVYEALVLRAQLDPDALTTVSARFRPVSRSRPSSRSSTATTPAWEPVS